MRAFTKAELIRIAHQHYPPGSTVFVDIDRSTPEFQRWSAAWKMALAWERWALLLGGLRAAFAGRPVGNVTQPGMSACLRCCVYLERPHPEGGRVLTRLAGAVSVLAPLYLVYATVQHIRTDDTWTRPQFFLQPPDEIRPHAELLVQHLERDLGYQPFPLELANEPVPGRCVYYLNKGEPSLLDALLDNDLGNLP
ncbi:MAG TPA: hypothetical protein VEU33_44100 [Archangium sp.]|nr:hypothetical protein [Archangium sp.]